MTTNKQVLIRFIKLKKDFIEGLKQTTPELHRSMIEREIQERILELLLDFKLAVMEAKKGNVDYRKFHQEQRDKIHSLKLASMSFIASLKPTSFDE